MSFLKKLFRARTLCPHCGNHDARETFGGIQCPNPTCLHHLSYQAPRTVPAPSPAPGPSTDRRNPRTGAPLGPARETWKPGPRLRLQYENWKRELKEFQADPASVKAFGARFSVRVEPTGTRLSLAHDKVRNTAELGNWWDALRNAPRGEELRVLRYHGRRGTTSERYEALKQKYPRWPKGRLEP